MAPEFARGPGRSASREAAAAAKIARTAAVAVSMFSKLRPHPQARPVQLRPVVRSRWFGRRPHPGVGQARSAGPGSQAVTGRGRRSSCRTLSRSTRLAIARSQIGGSTVLSAANIHAIARARAFASCGSNPAWRPAKCIRPLPRESTLISGRGIARNEYPSRGDISPRQHRGQESRNSGNSRNCGKVVMPAIATATHANHAA